MSTLLVFLAGLSLSAPTQDQKPDVDASTICEAIKKGVTYLRSQERACLQLNDVKSRKMSARELVLWTLINARVSPTDPLCQNLFNDMATGKLEATYPVALQTMILESLDRVRFQHRIAQCAQFLVDNQSEDGEWGYGSESPYADDIGRGMKPPRLPEVPSNLKVKSKVKVKKCRAWTQATDSSNTYFAALGLRAADDAGVAFERSVLDAGLFFWRGSRVTKNDESGWGYDRSSKVANPAATASAVSAILIYGKLLGRDLNKDPLVLGGSAMLANKWNGGRLRPVDAARESVGLHPYGLYAVEVAELFLGKEDRMQRDWYAEGTSLLLARQKPNGSWDTWADVVTVPGPYFSHPIWDTCFSILFLSSGIKPLQEPAPTKEK